MIVNSLLEIKSPPLFYHLSDFLTSSDLYIKLEGLNIAGSIKLKTARFLVDGLEKEGKLCAKNSVLIESSSGNLGIALSIICKERGYKFVCVTDPNILPSKEDLLRLYGAEIIKVKDKDISGGYLGTRISTIKNIIAKDDRYIWTNQYANQSNQLAHYTETAKEIAAEFSNVDYLFIGAGTTGTLMGCAQYFKEHSPETKIIAVDAAGSVTFGGEPKKRHIPGIGTSRKPELARRELIDEVIMIEEPDTVRMCRYALDRYGLFLGGSTGSVLEAVRKYGENIFQGATVIAISPDFGNPYIDTIYSDLWVEETFKLEFNKH